MAINTKQELAIQALLSGASDSKAAEAAGVTRQTVNEWKNNNIEFIAVFNQYKQSLSDEIQTLRKNTLNKAYRALEQKIDSDSATVGDLVKAIQLLETPQKAVSTYSVTVEQVQRDKEIKAFNDKEAYSSAKSWSTFYDK